MRINPKLFTVAEESQAIDTQEFDGRKVELFNMNDFPEVKDQFINESKFAVWSSVDGINYRVFIEEGYYKELKSLYSPAINKIWVDFWDTCESVSRKTSYRIVLPITIVSVATCFGVSFLPNPYSLYSMIAVVVIAFVLMLFFNRLTKKKIYEANVNSVDLIKKHLGSKNFDNLIERQKTYIDEYYKALYPEDEEDEEEVEQIETNDQASLEEPAKPEEETSVEEPVKQTNDEEASVEENSKVDGNE